MNSLASLGCKQLVEHATRYSICSDSQTLLDHVYTNFSDAKISCQILEVDISDHLPVLFKVKHSRTTAVSRNLKYRRDMKKFNLADFKSDLEISMSSLMEQSFKCPNIMAELFIDKFNSVIDHHAPWRKQNKKDLKVRENPWISKDIKKLIRKKQKKFKAAIKNPSANRRKSYKKIRNKLTHLIGKSKKKSPQEKILHMQI